MLPERTDAPLPTIYTCSVDIGEASLDMRVAPGGHSAPVRQEVANRGSVSFERVDLVATPWSTESGGDERPAMDPPAPPVTGPSRGNVTGVDARVIEPTGMVTEVSTAGAGAGYVVLAEGTAVAHGLEGGAPPAELWLRVSLLSDGLKSGTLFQTVEYQATCKAP